MKYKTTGLGLKLSARQLQRDFLMFLGSGKIALFCHNVVMSTIKEAK
jgi:hypothetical protein